MSTYINKDTGKPFRIDTLDAPAYIKNWLNHLLVVENLAPRTANNYFVQFRIFMRWTWLRDICGNISPETLESTPIDSIPLDLMLSVDTQSVYDYLSFASSVLDNQTTSRALKLSAIKSFYNYQSKVTHNLSESPVKDIPAPKREKRMPKYLTEDQCVQLLGAVDGDESERDYCIITFLVNCGMRLSELVGINMSDIHDDGSLRIFGKGRKERMIYLNTACIIALKDYLEQRKTIKGSKDSPALFLSKRTGQRLTGRRVQQIVERALMLAGLSGMGYSPHKLRHTAATLMYQHGNADVLILKEMLGHQNIQTTEVYTHLHQEQVKEAMEQSPLSQIVRGEIK